MQIEIAEDADALADLAADIIAQRLTDAGPDIGLAGGGTPRATYRRLARRRLPWPEVHAWTTDERHVPGDHPDSNAGMMRDVLFDHVAGTLHSVPWREDASAAALEYEAALAAVLPRSPTTVVLGVGEDGHTASLFPGASPPPADRDFVAVAVPDRGTRLTATPALLSRAALTVFLVSGAHKAAILAELLSGGSALPAARVASSSRQVLWLADRAAARLL